jgi:hypothetical protein
MESLQGSESPAMRDDLPSINEVIGFLSVWRPTQLSLIRRQSTHLEAMGVLEPGIFYGQEQPKDRKSKHEIATLQELAEVLIKVMPGLIAEANNRQIQLRHRLRRSAILSVCSDCFALLATSSSAIVVLLTKHLLVAVIGCVISFVASLFSLLARSFRTGLGGTDLFEVYNGLAEVAFLAGLLERELKSRLMRPLSTSDYDDVREKVNEGNEIARKLNNLLSKAC